MPPRRRPYTRYKRKGKGYNRKKITNQQTKGFQGNGQALLTINKGLGFPLRMRTKLRYVETGALTTGATGIMSIHSFRANGLYDPNHTNAGHQPMYYDQYMAVYNHWKVLGSKITVEIIPAGTSTQVPIHAALWVDDDFAYNGTFGQALELGVLKNYLLIGGQSKNTKQRLTNTWSLKKYFKDKYNAAQVTGNITSDPTEQSAYMLGFQAVDGVSEPNYNMIVTIDYIVDFFELKDTSQS